MAEQKLDLAAEVAVLRAEVAALKASSGGGLSDVVRDALSRRRVRDGVPHKPGSTKRPEKWRAREHITISRKGNWSQPGQPGMHHHKSAIRIGPGDELPADIPDEYVAKLLQLAPCPIWDERPTKDGGNGPYPGPAEHLLGRAPGVPQAKRGSIAPRKGRSSDKGKAFVEHLAQE